MYLIPTTATTNIRKKKATKTWQCMSIGNYQMCTMTHWQLDQVSNRGSRSWGLPVFQTGLLFQMPSGRPIECALPSLCRILPLVVAVATAQGEHILCSELESWKTDTRLALDAHMPRHWSTYPQQQPSFRQLRNNEQKSYQPIFALECKTQKYRHKYW